MGAGLCPMFLRKICKFLSTANPMDCQLMLIALPMDKLIVIYCLCEEGTDSAKMEGILQPFLQN